ncbi:hypothetical protein RND81_05G032700 [Saponaria officinalis]|uniref:Uncharacterized protein n=1 Tax=Saponaria officinalis TaxID=3572 RepID=A0AAW1KTV4_SAPOF
MFVITAYPNHHLSQPPNIGSYYIRIDLNRGQGTNSLCKAAIHTVNSLYRSLVILHDSSQATDIGRDDFSNMVVSSPILWLGPLDQPEIQPITHTASSDDQICIVCGKDDNMISYAP